MTGEPSKPDGASSPGKEIPAKLLRQSPTRAELHGIVSIFADTIKRMQERLVEVERKSGIVRNARPVVRSVTNVLKHGPSGRIESFEKVEGPPEELDLHARLERVEKALADAEGGAFRYRGVWRKDTTYMPGDFCTDHGSMWHCRTKAVGVRPGDGLVWQLAVKKGQDAKP